MNRRLWRVRASPTIGIAVSFRLAHANADGYAQADGGTPYRHGSCHPGAGALAFTRDAASRHTESVANRSANAHCCADSGSQPHDSYADAASSCLASDCCVVCSVQPGPHDSGDRQPGLNQHHWAADTAERRSLVGRSNGHQSSGNNGCA